MGQCSLEVCTGQRVISPLKPVGIVTKKAENVKPALSGGSSMSLIKRIRQWLKPEKRFKVHNLRDVSHATAKRYSAVLLVDRHCTKGDLREIVVEATQRIKHLDHYRNEQVEHRWKDEAAHVVWLFVAGDLKDVEHSIWLCRTEWIDPDFDFTFVPPGMNGDEQIDGIEIVWNNQYGDMRRVFGIGKAEIRHYGAD